MMRLPRTFVDYPSAYSSFEEIPSQYRLVNYESEFESEDTWEGYLSDQYPRDEYSDEHLYDLQRIADQWRDICESRDRHHALATPEIADQWCQILLSEMDRNSAKMNYLTPINKFYRYLLWHIDYPHTYNPIQFAVRDWENASTVWDANPWRDIDV